MEKSINRNGKFLNPIDRDILDSYFLQFVAGSQPINALAFVLDGLYYGFSDFGYAAYSMVLVGMISSVFLVIAAPLYGLAGVWTGLFLHALRMTKCLKLALENDECLKLASERMTKCLKLASKNEEFVVA
ncbi:hypothetical protein RHGRI_021224 [Rhododendron griersonianum]|uniref:Uncharacterized protein n=1 Tax=Rhododendron griersonianum TaxID=479676 RepID=A0AAV6JJG2_9ERIC|nr:hypothetical protein RHGRI_021224 [Rhododendron griersonianum]